MTCKPCGIAGDLVAVAREYGFADDTAPGILALPIAHSSQDYASVYTKEAIRSVAHLYHGLCKDCTCQHVIDFEGKTINRNAQG